ncbi:Reverse transcriptase Ty1/copia-type domain-containing protein [Abeliophyllum distichum]|uniref:Reverse transcriptase Ty1/copia-type domain-containing protein n=1 Tax=Abeliophyllum distichum TaxID=126358 RepID=A0ABD1PR74_9LAMI
MMPPIVENQSGIIYPPYGHNNFQLKPNVANTFALENPSDPWEACIMHSQEENSNSPALKECARYLQRAERMERRNKYMDLGTAPPQQPPSIQKAPTLELKQLPSHLRYAYLIESSTLPVIIANSINKD